MKKIFLINLTVLLTMVFVMSACKKDYIAGGIPENADLYKDSTTYDVLKGNPMYDTLVQIIDAAGLKDIVNKEGTTFFAPSDHAIFSYLNSRTIFVQDNYDINGHFGLDSLKYYLQNNVNGTKDSLLMYMVDKPLTYSVLTSNGALYPSMLTGDTVLISFEETTDEELGYTNLVSQAPHVVYFTQLWYHYDLGPGNTASDVPDNIGVRNLVKTSGILTKNGVLNLLDNSNSLFFYDTKQ
jgi:uncharacterized surface protein with fasciclin (FAS1) repeats